MMFYESKIKMLPGVHLPVRAVLLPLEKGSVLISPIPFSHDQIQSIRALTPVTDIIAPNLHHNKFVADARLKFPGANVWAPEGFRQKYPNLHVDRVLGEGAWPYKGELDLLALDGAPTMNEVAFLHTPSKTLIVGDLVFNILRPIGLLSPLIFKKFGTYKRFAMSKFWLKFVKDRAAFEASLRTLLEWDFETVVMAHGTPLTSSKDGSAKERLRASLQERGFLRN